MKNELLQRKNNATWRAKQPEKGFNEEERASFKEAFGLFDKGKQN